LLEKSAQFTDEVDSPLPQISGFWQTHQGSDTAKKVRDNSSINFLSHGKCPWQLTSI